MYIKTLTVSDINKYIKKAFDSDFILANCSIKGEISNFKFHSSGHMYFSLKDEYSRINCIMFRDSVVKLDFLPEDGMKVIVKGRISVYEKEGEYQLYCSEMKPEGKGELYLAFEKLKSKLAAVGLFDENHKKEIPSYASKIGIITSPTGAAVRDIINVTRRRNNKVELLIFPSLVQGVRASENVIEGICKFNSIEDVDLIIIARGGGSIEDLWCFNDEKLARAIYNSEKPIITGIGHEIDFTIADFVSDRRAPTPSAAAEIAVFNMDEFLKKLLNYKDALSSYIENRIGVEKDRLALVRGNLRSYSPMIYVINQYNVIDKFKQILDLKINTRISKEREKLAKINSLLSANNPSNVLNRGYSIIEDECKNIINTIDELDKKDKVKVIMKDGKGNFKFNRI
ncbi:MAG TPA: exodeoxyribonuclease VII large subunit [Clostridium sp.]|jgi:exodeoxyribonuclease VII large subunit|uniref:Exodeoxyribonuclease 7 large subunit n=1 Tax=Clostridium lapidicellarium TaxID=3240931 RepID=A0ABV4DSQ2_9CLOT|nr:exodeoxyribonuclease VII large subunit [uncultured Clostridium sp.]NLU08083.1 exodeoxyribonuclease VII large subunit [Clostridiales bacterium]HBC95688.1 exodeoxyribonuclease VII large subunit [Clostridium sp.]